MPKSKIFKTRIFKNSWEPANCYMTTLSIRISYGPGGGGGGERVFFCEAQSGCKGGDIERKVQLFYHVTAEIIFCAS